MTTNDPFYACRHLTVARPGRILVDDLSLDIQAGHRWVVIGPNGAGKSSLLLTLLGALAPQTGTWCLLGRPLDTWSAADQADQRSWVADRWLDPFPVRIGDFLQRARRGVADPISDVFLAQCFDAWGITDCLDRDLLTLSRGERQRVALAAALCQRPRCVLMDEPLAHQDPRFQGEIIDRMREFPSLTQVCTMHDLGLAGRWATHVLALDGQGGWQAGAVEDLLVPEVLSRVFSCRVQVASTDEGARTFFWG